MHSNIFERLSFVSLFLVVVLLPIFFLPFNNIPIEISKGILLVLGLALCIIFWAIARFLDGRIVFSKSPLLLSGLGIVLVFLLSALSSKNPQVSLFGTMFDIGSFWFIFSAFVLMFMSSIIFRTPKRAKIALLGVILSSALVLIFQSFHLFMPAILSLGVLTNKISNVFGSWNALGLFAGFSGLMFLLVVEFFPISKTEKPILTIFILLSILLAAAVNFPLVWILLGVSSLIIFVYKVSVTFQKRTEDRNGEYVENGELAHAGDGEKHFPLISFVVVIIALLFFLSSGRPVATFIPNYLEISNTEVGPSLGSTVSVTKGVLVKNPVFGIGPNRFGEAWAMYKPQSINDTQFWDVSFGSGSGLLPTLIATTGGLGLLAWFVFFVLFLVIGVRSVFFSIKNGVNWEMMAFFVLSLYLFISSFFYFTGAVIFLLAFAFTGIFIGLAGSNSGKEASILFLNDHRKSFFTIMALILVVIFSVAISFKYMERFTSIAYFGKARLAPTFPEAENFINKALSLYSNDLYLRTHSQIYLVKLDSLVQKGETLSDAEKADLQTSFDQAINSAQRAIAYNPSNYINFQLLGSIYQAIGTLGATDAYGQAFLAFQTASSLNPLNPGLKLAMASVSFLDGKVQEAKDYANLALSLKPDYIDALLTLSQIAKSEGDNTGAISYAERALAIAPTDENLIKYVNSLKNGASAPTITPAEE